MTKAWIAGRFRSIYLKIFLSFLATCVLFFVGLGIFWSYYFSGLFYKEKINLLETRSKEITWQISAFQEGSISIRELRITSRIVARSINGQVWLVDARGMIMNGSSDSEGAVIPSTMDTMLINGIKGGKGYGLLSDKTGEKHRNNVFTYYAPSQLAGKPIVVILQVPAGEISEAISAVRMNILVPLLFSLVAVALILYIISRKLAGPLMQMNRAALELAGGDFTTRVPVSSHDEVGQLAASFNFMVEQLEQWEDNRQEFLTNVSHELRSPLTTLRGFIVAMNDRIIPKDKYSDYLRLCDYEVQRLQRLVNDLLDLARIQNGVDVFRLRPVNIRVKLEEVLDLLKTPIAQKEMALRVIVPMPDQEPVMVCLDPDRFAQIVQNLIYNALQFSSNGSTITVALEARKAEAVLYVRDTGVGMSEEELTRIWERFYKADNSRHMHSEGGTGLGLTIVKHLVNGMKGTIHVESRPGEGTEFQINFPRVQE